MHECGHSQLLREQKIYNEGPFSKENILENTKFTPFDPSAAEPIRINFATDSI